ncbi:hypothetical protein LEP1GSC036_0252 [Leptospira weilii str. 2006001853]|uniref:Uncharacterized protein n=1 Tax=Leptospira weilii str. 2006001853 TaxID=1001589 RepID=A0A828Z4C1_9LEPT|nr:hypothetical protein LEP1GSC036_0252 [Leptospira weilii str. 2006001853]
MAHGATHTGAMCLSFILLTIVPSILKPVPKETQCVMRRSRKIAQ